MERNPALFLFLLRQTVGTTITDFILDVVSLPKVIYTSEGNVYLVGNGQPAATYSFDDNGNLLASDTLTNTFDAANRLTQAQQNGTIIEPLYNGVNDRVAQVSAGVTTTFALDVQGLPEVIYTSDGEAYLHLPGVIVTEKAGEVRYLLSDGLGSIRQIVDENAEIVVYNEFDPYGNPVQDGGEPYGYTGEWWENDVGLLHLRARWYLT